MSTMTMADFQNKLVDAEHKKNNNHDEVNKRLDDFQIKLKGQTDNIKKLQDTTDRIEIKMENNRIQTEVDLKESLTLLKLLCRKMNCTPAQILQENEDNQEHNSSDSTKSTNSH